VVGTSKTSIVEREIMHKFAEGTINTSEEKLKGRIRLLVKKNNTQGHD